MPLLYGFADPHLGRSISHSMAEYGLPWIGHPQTLFERWNAVVPKDAYVLVPGDISVATKRQDILKDYADLESLNGALKILSPGNHDDSSVWATQGKVRAATEPYPSLLAIKGTAERLAVGDGPGLVVTAVRGSLTPGSERYDSDERRVQYTHELRRLELALTRAHALMLPEDQLLVCIHYPPFSRLNEESEFTRMIEAAGTALCVYGHIHTSPEHELAFQGIMEDGGCRYRLLAADYLQMTPLLLGELTQSGFTLL
jgi:predicted phosphohydrolase